MSVHERGATWLHISMWFIGSNCSIVSQGFGPCIKPKWKCQESSMVHDFSSLRSFNGYYYSRSKLKLHPLSSSFSLDIWKSRNAMTYFVWILNFFFPKRWKLVAWTLKNMNIKICLVKTYIDSENLYTT